MRYNIDYVGLAGTRLLIVAGWAILKADERARFHIRQGGAESGANERCLWYGRADLEKPAQDFELEHRGLGFCALLSWESDRTEQITLVMCDSEDKDLLEISVETADASSFNSFFFECSQRVRLHLVSSLSEIGHDLVYPSFQSAVSESVGKWCLEIDSFSGSLMPYMPACSVEASFSSTGFLFLALKGTLDSSPDELVLNFAVCNAKIENATLITSGKIDPAGTSSSAETSDGTSGYSALFLAETHAFPLSSESIVVVVEVVADGRPYYTRFELRKREAHILDRMLVSEAVVLTNTPHVELSPLRNFLFTQQKSRLSRASFAKVWPDVGPIGEAKFVVLTQAVDSPAWLRGIQRVNFCHMDRHVHKILVYEKSGNRRSVADLESLLINDGTMLAVGKDSRDLSAQIPAGTDCCFLLPSTSVIEPDLIPQLKAVIEAKHLADSPIIEVIPSDKSSPISPLRGDDCGRAISSESGMINPLLLAPDIARAFLVACLDYKDLDLNIHNILLVGQSFGPRARMGSPHLRNYNKFNLENSKRHGFRRALATFIAGN